MLAIRLSASGDRNHRDSIVRVVFGRFHTGDLVEAKHLDIIATPADVMAFLASLAGPHWVLVSADETLQRVILQTPAHALSFGVQVQASIISIPRGCRVILDSKRVHPLNITAGIGAAVRTIEGHLRRRFPEPVGQPV